MIYYLVTKQTGSVLCSSVSTAPLARFVDEAKKKKLKLNNVCSINVYIYLLYHATMPFRCSIVDQLFILWKWLDIFFFKFTGCRLRCYLNKQIWCCLCGIHQFSIFYFFKVYISDYILWMASKRWWCEFKESHANCWKI